MKILSQRWLGLLILFLSLSSYAQTPPAFPNEFFQFPPGFDSFYDAPIAYTTNLTTIWVDVPPDYGDALILDTTNTAPAYLEYYVVGTNFNVNLSYGAGSIVFYFAPNWASVSQGGTGPGDTAYFISAGDTSTNGMFDIYADAPGSNLYFGGVYNGVPTTYASAPISWASNTFHQIGVEWFSPTRGHPSGTSSIYLDSMLAATGSGESIVPWLGTDTNGFYTNGFFIGSDNTGYEQARGAFWTMDTWAEAGQVYTSTNEWTELSNAIVAWQATLGGGGFGGLMGMLGGGLLTEGGSSGGCVFGTNVYFTNMTSMPDTNGDGGWTFAFAIEGGRAEWPMMFSPPPI